MRPSDAPLTRQKAPLKLFVRRRDLGVSIGVAGASLQHSGSWAQDDKVGAVARLGEVRTARVLDAAAARPGGFTVLHDLTLPGSRANIDHVIVHGNEVLVLDSKVWAAGRYVTRDGATTRDGRPFPAADSLSLVKAAERLTKQLVGTGAQMSWPSLLVWPSPTAETAPDVSKVSVPGLRVWPAEDGLTVLRGRAFRQSANPAVVVVLRGLVVEQRGEG